MHGGGVAVRGGQSQHAALRLQHHPDALQEADYLRRVDKSLVICLFYS